MPDHSHYLHACLLRLFLAVPYFGPFWVHMARKDRNQIFDRGRMGLSPASGLPPIISRNHSPSIMALSASAMVFCVYRYRRLRLSAWAQSAHEQVLVGLTSRAPQSA